MIYDSNYRSEGITMSRFQDALSQARLRAIQQYNEVSIEHSENSEDQDVVVGRLETDGGMIVSISRHDGFVGSAAVVRPVHIDLDEDRAAATRVVRSAARRVINQHLDEIEALAYK